MNLDEVFKKEDWASFAGFTGTITTDSCSNFYVDSSSNNLGGSNLYPNGQHTLGNISFYPYVTTTSTSWEGIVNQYSIDEIIKTIKKIKDGGKSQLLFSMKSENELEKKLAIELIHFLSEMGRKIMEQKKKWTDVTFSDVKKMFKKEKNLPPWPAVKTTPSVDKTKSIMGNPRPVPPPPQPPHPPKITTNIPNNYHNALWNTPAITGQGAVSDYISWPNGYGSGSTKMYTVEQMMEMISEVGKKGKKQLIFNLKSESETERQIARTLIKFLGDIKPKKTKEETS